MVDLLTCALLPRTQVASGWVGWWPSSQVDPSLQLTPPVLTGSCFVGEQDSLSTSKKGDVWVGRGLTWGWEWVRVGDPPGWGLAEGSLWSSSVSHSLEQVPKSALILYLVFMSSNFRSRYKVLPVQFHWRSARNSWRCLVKRSILTRQVLGLVLELETEDFKSILWQTCFLLFFHLTGLLSVLKPGSSGLKTAVECTIRSKRSETSQLSATAMKATPQVR